MGRAQGKFEALAHGLFEASGGQESAFWDQFNNEYSSFKNQSICGFMVDATVRPEMIFMGSQAYDGILANGNKAREVGDSTIAMTLRRACNVCIPCCVTAMVFSLSFSVIVVCTCLSKLIHLHTYMGTVPHAGLILFLPSVLVPDILVICLSRLFLSRKRTTITYISRLLGCTFSLILLVATAFHVTFHYKTGTEVTWTNAQAYVRDKDGIKLLLSGSNSAIVCVILILGISWFSQTRLYQYAGRSLNMVTAPLLRAPQLWNMCKRRRGCHSVEDTYDYQSFINSRTGNSHGKAYLDLPPQANTGSSRRYPKILALAIFLYLALTASLRPSSAYSQMSASLPITMLQMIDSHADGQANRYTFSRDPWPFPQLIHTTNWEKPKGYFKGWAPGDNSILAQMYRDRLPTWLPEAPPAGFCKWLSSNHSNQVDREVGDGGGTGRVCHKTKVDGMFYNPVNDPLRITNQDEGILDILSDAFRNGTVKIKHVALIMLESTREELFPLQQGSDIHNIILDTHKGRKDGDDVNALLSQLTPVAEKITGKSGCWKRTNGSDLAKVPIPEWNGTTQDGYGGINIIGGFAAASLSFKSLAATHCGVWPMPVDGFQEFEAQSYQPCISQILHLFNQIKGSNSASNDFLEQQWFTAFFQSITDKYDRQDIFNNELGFEEIVAKDVLEQRAKARSDLEEINYFGYPETTLKTHVRELIEKVQREKKRMFFSHFTSTTHHPWGLPRDSKKIEYVNTQGKMGWHRDFNNYLNTVRFQDAWLGELLQLFEQHGIANETLVVLVGDHGQAFKEDITTRTGTYKNGHVSNFRVPITFRHPHIPRVQYEANATSISILPTILDLLINTGSLNRKDMAVASDLLHDYEGQSLIRPYKSSRNGRRAWNFGVINSGASMLSVTSADAPWRLVIPLDRASQWRFTNLKNDPLELEPLEKWSMEQLVGDVRNLYGEEASQWVVQADAVAQWWAWERKRLWGYKTTK
ncbi:alkaline-phosphatase-like protein [Fusarium oxysporum]|nr:alkaline-phosphatase-like protein [Fusarium oxysporum]